MNTGQRKGNEVNTRRSFFSLLLAGPAAAWAAIHAEKPWFICRDCGASVSKGDTRWAPWAKANLHPMYYVDGQGPLCDDCAGMPKVRFANCHDPEEVNKWGALPCIGA